MGEGNHIAYFAQAIQRMADQGCPIHVVEVGDRCWIEIDTIEDLQRARNLDCARGMGRITT